MHVPTHIMSGWCVADLLELTPRERMFAMVAATAADLDGLGLLVSIDWYAEYHHVLGHNLLFGLFLSAVLSAFSVHRLKSFALYLGLFHLHLVLDYFGSGPGWPIRYFGPYSSAEFQSRYAWPLDSWQNVVAACICFSWIVVIGIRRRRTPLETLMPSVDARIFQRPNKPARGASERSQ